MPLSRAKGAVGPLFGENRCVPCLLVNVVLLVGVSALLAVASLPVGVGFAVVGGIVLLHRGYLVPYTPVFAPRLVARLPWNPFEKPRPSDALEYRNDGDGEELLGALVRAGIVTAEADELALDQAFESRWYERMRELRSVSTDRLARRIRRIAPGATEATVTDVNDTTYVVLSDGSDDLERESWLSRPVAIAETAAAELLRDEEVGPDRRARAAHVLPMFLRSCPACGTEVVEEPAGGCCGPPEVGPSGDRLLALVCKDCSVQLFTFEA